MTISVIGLGFVGLTTALGFCEKGYKVYGLDIDKHKINLLRKGEIPFFEPGLSEALNKYIDKLFIVGDSLKAAISESEVIFYCVGTPGAEDGSVDLTYIYDSIKETLNEIDKSEYKILVIKSTIPPGATKERILPFIESRGFLTGRDIGLANNPEFLREGYAWEDFINPDRIVIGISDQKSGHILENLYAPFGSAVHKVSLNTAEFIKYLSNTLLSTLISYSNEMSIIADTIGDINIKQSFKILHEDKRWFGKPANMTSYAYPGCGFGGYCLPKDTEAIYMQARAKGFDARGLRHVLDMNNTIKDFVVSKIEKNVPVESKIGILGLSFKPNSDDVRDTPAKTIIEKLIEKGYSKIIAYDPLATAIFSKTYQLPIQYAKNLLEIVDKSDALVLLTAWDEFRKNKDLLLTRPVYDFRYFL